MPLSFDNTKSGSLSDYNGTTGSYFWDIANHGKSCEHVGNVRARVVFGDPEYGILEQYECLGELITIERKTRTPLPYPQNGKLW